MLVFFLLQMKNVILKFIRVINWYFKTLRRNHSLSFFVKTCILKVSVSKCIKTL